MLKAVVLFLFGGNFYDDFFFARTIFKTRFVCEDGSAMCFASGPIFGNKGYGLVLKFGSQSSFVSGGITWSHSQIGKR